MTTDLEPTSAAAAPSESESRFVPPTTVIEPRPGWRPLELRELWRYRDLLWILGLRDVKVRYKQTILGAAWALLQPLLTVVVFTIFFGRLGGMQQFSTVPYAVLTLCGLLPWQLFAMSLTAAGNSLIQNQTLVTKVYFPRLAIPISAMLCPLVDFLISISLLAGLFAFHQVVPTWRIAFFPLMLLATLLTSLAVGLWLSALNVEYRDVRYAIPFLIQFWMFASPVAYPSTIVPERWRLLYSLNPMVGVIDGFRWCLLAEENNLAGEWAISLAVTCALLAGGLYYFRRMERGFADVI